MVWSRRLVTAVLVLSLPWSLCCTGMKYRPVVTVEDTEESTTATTLPADTTVRSPSCVDVAMPRYPGAALEASLTPVLVRVDFVVDDEGRTHGVSARALADTSFRREFETASELAVLTWTCLPAWWIKRVPDRPWERATMESPAYVVFRFDKESVDGRARLEQLSKVHY